MTAEQTPLDPYAPPRDGPEVAPRVPEPASGPVRRAGWLLIGQAAARLLVWLLIPESIWLALVEHALTALAGAIVIRFPHRGLAIALLFTRAAFDAVPLLRNSSVEHSAVIQAVGVVTAALTLMPFALLLLGRPSRSRQSVAVIWFAIQTLVMVGTAFIVSRR